QPDSPTRPRFSPWSIASETPSTARMTPLPPPNNPGRAAKCLVKFSTATSSLTVAPYRCNRSKTVVPLALRAGRSRSLADARSLLHLTGATGARRSIRWPYGPDAHVRSLTLAHCCTLQVQQEQDGRSAGPTGRTLTFAR